MTKRPVPPDMIPTWTEGLFTSPDVRRDVATTPKTTLLDTAEQLRSFTKPTAVVWITHDRTVPRAHNRALAGRI